MEPLIGTLETILYIEVVLNIQWNLCKGHIGTLETVLYIEVVLNLELIYSGTSVKDTLVPWKLSFI